MLPIPTRAAIASFVGLLIMALIGLTTSTAGLVAIANAGFIGLAWALAASRPKGRDLRRQRLEFAWWLDHGTGAASGAVVPGVEFLVRCYVRHRGSGDISVDSLEPIVGPNVTVLRTPQCVQLGERTRTEFTMSLRAAAVGRVVLHGLAITVRGPLGLFRTALYFPNPLVIKVLPRAAARRRSAARAPRAAAVERAGHTMVRRRGGGTELHELREHQSGDPFKAIAWKASARRGRLMVKEVEQEVQEARWLVLDVSGTMRGGPLGSRKLDHAIDLAAMEATDAVKAGDRVGLVAFDRRIVTQVPLGEGAAHRIRIYEALLSLTELVDADLTDLSEASLVAQVARYVRRQDGIDFGRGSNVDLAGLITHVERGLVREDRDKRASEREILAADRGSRTLRRFCRTRGLPLPHLAHPIEHEKTDALIASLTWVAQARTPSSILVCTDFDAMTLSALGTAAATPEASTAVPTASTATHDSAETLATALRLARAHGHTVQFVLPDARTFLEPSDGAQLTTDLTTIFGRAEAERLRQARTMLARHGIRATVARGKRPTSAPPGPAMLGSATSGPATKGPTRTGRAKP